ncbi:JNK-interacting protein 3 [Varanus komodoensis]|nr:JNK-interacting protein 3 [Varanus komodoensis]
MDDLEETFGGYGDPNPAPYEELVSVMAGSLYSELEKLVGAHGPGTVSGLLPQLVSVLESLQGACEQVRERDQALERLRDDRLRLLEQYERERAGRKRAEERFMELEDTMEQEHKAHLVAVSRLEGHSRALEGKARSYADQVASLEEQKSSLLKELSTLGQSHTKVLQSYKELKLQKAASAAVGQAGSPSAEAKRLKLPAIREPPQCLPNTPDAGPPEVPQCPQEPAEIQEVPCSEKTSQGDAGRNVFPLLQEMWQPEKDAPTAQLQGFNLEDLLSATPELGADPEKASSPLSTTLERNTVSLFAEVSGLSPELLSDMDNGADLQSDPLETLMAENTRLQEARITLDTARRHLIARVEELSEERESLRMEREGTLAALSRCQAQLKEAELELIRVRQEFEETRRSSEDGEAEGGLSRPHRFTRAEMARVVMERNLYKERLMELQEAVRRTELLRASREEQAVQMKKSSFWKIFDRLFSPSDSPERSPASPLPPGRARSSPTGRGELGRNGGQLPPALRYIPRATSPGTTADSSPQQKRRELYREIRSHIWQEHGRAQIHGWSQPPALQGHDPPSGGADVPVLMQLRMLDQKDPSTKLACGTLVYSSAPVWELTHQGLLTTSGERVDSPTRQPFQTQVWAHLTTVFVSPLAALVRCSISQTSVPRSTQDIFVQLFFKVKKDLSKGTACQDFSGSAQLWVAAGTHSVSEVTLFDAQNTSQLLEHFVLPGIHVLSIAWVPGLTVPGRGSPEGEPKFLEHPLAPQSDSEDEVLETEAVGTTPTVWFGTQEGW